MNKETAKEFKDLLIKATYEDLKVFEDQIILEMDKRNLLMQPQNRLKVNYKMERKEIEIDNKKYKLFNDETVFRFTSALGCVLAEGVIFIKELKALKEFREKTQSTEVFIFNKTKNMFQRADQYLLEVN